MNDITPLNWDYQSPHYLKFIVESKHIDIIIAMCNSKNNSFSLDLPGPIIINATKGEVSLEKLISK